MDSQETIQSCQLIGVAGIIIQIVLGTLSFSVLIYKRYTQKPKRAWKIWMLDTSKQGVSQMLAHFVNIAISVTLSSSLSSDACIWYLTTNILDNTVGVFLCVGVLSVIEKNVLAPNYTRFQSGNYYTAQDDYDQNKTFDNNPSLNQPYMTSLEITCKHTKYEISYFDWLIQFIIWNAIVVVSKTVLFYFELLLSNPIIDVAVFLIGWIQPYETLELILVIIIVPVIMNGLAFWIQDNFLKKKQGEPKHQSDPQINQKNNRESRESTTVNNEPKPDIHQALL